jgi:cell division protease FtsH
MVTSLNEGGISDAFIFPDSHMRALDTGGVAHDVQLLPMQVSSVIDRFADAGVDVTLVPPSMFVTVLRTTLDSLPFLILMFVTLSMFGRMGPMLARMDPNNVVGGGAPDVATDVTTTFDDVAGLSTAKEELFEVVECLRDPERFAASGARTPRGCLLEGPPGTGKTLLARAVAGEANASFIATTASSFVEMYVGLGAARVRSLFKRAQESSPCIVWIDEIDAVARQRGGGGPGGGNEERETTLNELLSAMDGFAGDTGVVVLAATNRADVLDEALLRPGRFDRRIPVTLPEIQEREDILRVHTRDKILASDVDLGVLSRQTPGFSGAELENLMNEAALRALRRSDIVIQRDDVTDALDRITVGLPRNSTQSFDVRERVAVHEAGHAIVGQTIEEFDNVSRVTIVPRSSGAGGFTSFIPNESRNVNGLYTRDYLEAQLAVLLAGRAAEALVLGEDTISVGASNDLQRARGLAERMTVEWALDGSVLRDTSDGVSEHTLRRVDERVEDLLDKAYSRATSIINAQHGELLRLIRRLLEENTVDDWV